MNTRGSYKPNNNNKLSKPNKIILNKPSRSKTNKSSRSNLRHHLEILTGEWERPLPTGMRHRVENKKYDI